MKNIVQFGDCKACYERSIIEIIEGQNTEPFFETS